MNARTYRLISADSHINEPPDMFTRRLPAKFKDRAPHMQRLPEGDAWIMEGATDPINFGLNCNVGAPIETRNLWIKWEDVRKGGYDPAARLAEQDQDGVELEIMYPTPRISNQLFWHNGDAEFHVACIRAYNDWLAEFCAHAPDRFWGAALMPTLGVKAAIEELQRVRAMPGMRAAMIGRYPEGGEALKPEDDAFFTAAAEAGMPVAIHVGFATGPSGDRVKMKMQPVFRFLDATLRTQQMVDGGVFDRIPDLKLVLVEVDASWLPYVEEQMDDRHVRAAPARRAKIRELPSHYFKKNISTTFVTDTYGIANRHAIGVERMMWSSDYPHTGANWPNSMKVIHEQFAGVPADEQHAILAGNALRIYGAT